MPSDPAQQPGTASFTDVSSQAWYADAVKYVSENGFMNGTEDTVFSPDGSMTRGMFVTVLYRMSGAERVGGTEANDRSAVDTGEIGGSAVTGESKVSASAAAGDELSGEKDSASGAAAARFEDVPENAYYADAVAWAAENGIVTGVDSSHFEPSAFVTRQQMAAVMYRYDAYRHGTAGNQNVSGSAGSGELSAYSDAASVASYAREAFAWAVDREIITGIKEGSSMLLRPAGTASRAQCAAILMRYDRGLAA